MRRRPLGLAALVVATAAVVAALLPGAAAAAPNTSLRLTHLSPDTPAVDVMITSAHGRTYQIRGIGYGAVSPYAAVDPDTYTVQMRPAGTPTAPPIVTGTVRADAGGAYTAAVLRPQTGASITQFADDLTRPGPGGARVRLLDATPEAGSVTATWNGAPVAGAVSFGTATEYVSTPAGRGTFALTPTSGAPFTLNADLVGGGLYTVIVLPRDGRVSGEVNVDALAAAAAVVGGNTTGNGGGGQYPSNTTPTIDVGTFATIIGSFESWDDAIGNMYGLCASSENRPSGLSADDCRKQIDDFVRRAEVKLGTPSDDDSCSATWVDDPHGGYFAVGTKKCVMDLDTSREEAITTIHEDPDGNGRAFVASNALVGSVTALSTAVSTGGPTGGPTAGPTGGPTAGPTAAPTAVVSTAPPVEPTAPQPTATDPGNNNGGNNNGGGNNGGGTNAATPG